MDEDWKGPNSGKGGGKKTSVLRWQGHKKKSPEDKMIQHAYSLSSKNLSPRLRISNNE